ncbi:MAG TPA: gas vesicle protein GvpD P-loop domain-containing protein [Thermoplasmata archaeon]|nr:gas vesicle protein GvpD P-loop domain-containing protein [Thermoplasmata archaeon]
MSTLLDLPRELYDFLSRPSPQSLLIRGPAGSGKTTLGIALLENFPGRRILVSSRVAQDELVREFPRLSNGGAVKVVDGSHLRHTLPEIRTVLQGAGRVILDAEKDPTVRGLWLPSPVREAVEQLGTGENALVVIDSWDALVERYLGSRLGATHGLPDRAELERTLLDLMSRGPVFLALILEEATPTALDYLVNGVLETGWEGVDGRAERWVRLRKLRGVRIDSAQYPFSLEGGRFHCITPISVEGPSFLARAEPDPSPVPGTIWPGSADYALAFGRLALHRLTLIERDFTVPEVATRLVVSTAVAHTLEQGGRVGEMLPPSVLPEEFYRSYSRILPVSEFVRQVRFLTVAHTPELPDELRPAILPPLDRNAVGTEPRSPELARFLTETPPDRPALLLSWLSGLRAISSATGGSTYTPETLPGVALRYLMGAPLHAIFVGPESDPLTVALRSMASVRIRLQQRHGRVFVFGEQPVTPGFVLTEGDEQVSYRLLRIV